MDATRKFDLAITAITTTAVTLLAVSAANAQVDPQQMHQTPGKISVIETSNSHFDFRCGFSSPTVG
jgi:hypothetical protein